MRGARVLSLAAAAACACDGASGEPGSGALLQIPGAQFEPGEPPGDEGGPEVVALSSRHTQIQAGAPGERIQGSLAAAATGVCLYVPGDDGYWILTAGAPDVQVPDLPTLDVRVGFSRDLPPGAFELVAQAVDRDGRFGPPRALALTAVDDAPPDGALVVSLSWDTESDLDLHVVDPGGIEIWSGNPNSYVPPLPGEPPDDPDAWQAGGILDVDSNSDCRIDGRRRENIVWQEAAPPGRYRVQVDTFSLCGAPSARWEVQALQAGDAIAHAAGLSLPADAQKPHGRGAGVLALEFEIP